MVKDLYQFVYQILIKSMVFILLIMNYSCFFYSGYLHAYISYLWEGAGPCLFLLSTSPQAFYDLSKIRKDIEDKMPQYKNFGHLKNSLTQPDPFFIKQVQDYSNDFVIIYFNYRCLVMSYGILCTKMFIYHRYVVHPQKNLILL